MDEIAAAPPARISDRSFYAFAAVLSSGALAFIAYILLVRQHAPEGGVELRFLPPVNASLNALAAALLVAGYVSIKRGAREVHKYCMVAAFVASTLFLACYLTYHYVHGDTKFAGTGTIRIVYLLILATHVLLSMAIVPLALTSFFFAFTERFARHRRIARWTLPIWLYVSVTGVAIYFMLRSSPPLVRDIRPGMEASNPNDLTAVGGTLYFTADDGVTGHELWRSDGTASGTAQVKDIRPGAGSGISERFSTALLTPAGNLVFFEASDGLSGIELWQSDGTAAGTAPVADLNPGAADSVPAPLAVANGKLFFGADAPGVGRELWALEVDAPARSCVTILGQRLRMESEGVDPATRRIVVSAREPSSPDALLGDPITDGVRIDLVAAGTTSAIGSFVLSAGAWTRGGAGWVRRASGAYQYP